MHEPDEVVRFVPSRAEGLPDVGEVIVYPNRLEISTGGSRRAFRFASVARRQERALVSFLKPMLGLKPWPRLVGERHWCGAPKDRFIRWYTNPSLTTYMPANESHGYADSLFPRIHEVLASGGFATFDLA